ncbi:MAG: ABC transporter permease subunit [Burkholderiaceae bacterium]
MALATWAVAGAVLPAYLVAGPIPVIQRAWLFVSDRQEALHLAVSFGHVLASTLFAFIVGGMLAFANHYLPVTRLMIQHRWYPFLNSFSGIAWAILALLWLGPGHVTVVFAITAVLVPFVFINLREGLVALDAELLEMADSFTRKSWRDFRLIVLPSLYPFIFAALRICFGVAWKATLIAELFGGKRGLGFLLNVARQEFDGPTVFAVILVVVLVVFIADRWIFMPMQRRLSRHYANV